MSGGDALLRRFPIAVSVEALALAWARQEAGPATATVVVDAEISPRGLHGRLWDRPAERTLACAMVLRPPLTPDEADLVWLAGGLAATNAAATIGGEGGFAPLWPDSCVAVADEQTVGMVSASVQLGPGTVRSAVVCLRLDLDALGGERERDLPAVRAALAEAGRHLDADPTAVVASYGARCHLTGRRVRAALLPRGEARGTVRGVDRTGRLTLESATGMVEQVGLHQLRSLELR